MPPCPRIRLPHAHGTHHNHTSTPLPPRQLLSFSYRSSVHAVHAVPRCSLSISSSLTGPEFPVLPPLASCVRVAVDMVALSRGFVARSYWLVVDVSVGRPESSRGFRVRCCCSKVGRSSLVNRVLQLRRGGCCGGTRRIGLARLSLSFCAGFGVASRRHG
jgi:hypothetical protein